MPETDRYQRDRDLFIAVISHELRTPVTVIKGYADTLSQHWDSLTEPDRQQAARVIGQRAGELARLLDRLLAATNDVDAVGGAPAVPFDLLAALRTAAGDLPADLQPRLALELPATLPAASGHPGSIASILTELVRNADKHAGTDRPITLTASADDHTVAFQVNDRGTGVPPEHAEHAFEGFWHSGSPGRPGQSGAGLGLHLVRRITARQHGWVSLRARAGGGTVVEIRLRRG